MIMALFTIGEFARLGRVPVKTLRYYDEIGLFRPAEVDPSNGYRRYATAQLGLLNRVLALKGLGFGLDEVRQLIGQQIGVAELQGMLLLRRTELERTRAETDRRIAEVEIRLRHIEQEDFMIGIDILTKTVPRLTVAGARATVPSSDQMRERCIGLNDAACQTITSLGLHVDGPSLALYYPHEEAIDVEMAYPVRDPGHRGDHGGAVHTLPETDVAYAVYSGSYDDFGAVGRLHIALRDWVAARGRTTSAPVRELYLQPPGPSGPDGVMELQYPLR